MDWLAAERSSDRFVVMGICSGATFALRAASADPRVAGVILANFQGGLDQESRSFVNQTAKASHLWRVSLFSARSWGKVLTGGADYRGILQGIAVRLGPALGLRRRAPIEAAVDRERIRSLLGRGGRILVVNSEADPSLRYMEQIVGGAGPAAGLVMETISGADHTFTALSSQRALLQLMSDWTLESFLQQEKAGPDVRANGNCRRQES
jgi:hypothetical protein